MFNICPPHIHWSVVKPEIETLRDVKFDSFLLAVRGVRKEAKRLGIVAHEITLKTNRLHEVVVTGNRIRHIIISMMRSRAVSSAENCVFEDHATDEVEHFIEYRSAFPQGLVFGVPVPSKIIRGIVANIRFTPDIINVREKSNTAVELWSGHTPSGMEIKDAWPVICAMTELPFVAWLELAPKWNSGNPISMAHVKFDNPEFNYERLVAISDIKVDLMAMKTADVMVIIRNFKPTFNVIDLEIEGVVNWLVENNIKWSTDSVGNTITVNDDDYVIYKTLFS